MRRILRTALALVVVIVLAIAGTLFLTRRPIDLSAHLAGPASTPDADTPDIDLAFSILPTATLNVAEGTMFEGGSWLTQRKMDHSAVLICHPQGLILFDTGLGRDIDGQFSEFPLINRIAFSFQKLSTAAAVIAADKPCPGRPLIIIPSHLHWDHAGGIEDFPDAEVWIRAEELQQARAMGTGKGFLPGQIDAETIKWHPFTLTDRPYEQYSTSLDFFGDGSLVLVPMAGHTAGSVGLFVTTHGNRYFFTGDTTWALEGFTRPAHKFAAARAMVDFDVEKLDAEIAGVHDLMSRAPDLVVIPAHDANAYPAGSIYPNWIGWSG